MKKHILGLGSLTLVALSATSVVACTQVYMSEKVQKELGYIDNNGKPNLEIKLSLKDDKVFEVTGYKPIKDFVITEKISDEEINEKIKNADIESFITKNLKVSENFSTITENVKEIKFASKKIAADKIELKNGKVDVEYKAIIIVNADGKKENPAFGHRWFDLKDHTMDANTVESEILSKIKATDIKITSTDKTKADFEAIISEKTELGKVLNKFEKITTAKFTIEFVSATDATGKVKADSDKLNENDKVTVKVTIKDLTSAKAVTITDIVVPAKSKK